MRRLLETIFLLTWALPGLALARPSDRRETQLEEPHSAPERLGTGGASLINSGLRLRAEALWTSQRPPATAGQLTGPVVLARGRTLYVQSGEGAVVPFDLSQLRLYGRNPLTEGMEVRVTFANQGQRNLATGLERVVTD
jgi:hypothetical protein